MNDLRSNLFTGIQCPKCGSLDLRVVETRRREKAIGRVRECDRRHRFYTVELVADDEGLPSTTPEDAFDGGCAVTWRARNGGDWVPIGSAGLAQEIRELGWEVQSLGVIGSEAA